MAKKTNLNGKMKLTSTSDLTLEDILAYVQENLPCGGHDQVEVRNVVDGLIASAAKSGSKASRVATSSGGAAAGSWYDISGIGSGCDLSQEARDRIVSAVAGNAVLCRHATSAKAPGVLAGVEAASGKYADGIAENSVFYRAVLANGEVWSPYTNRRFLPAQFMHLMVRNGNNVDKGISVEYDFRRFRRLLRDEVEKIAFMEKNWRTAFMERSKFFPVDTVRRIIIEQLRALEDNLGRRELCRFSKRHNDYYRKVEGRGNVALWHVTKCVTGQEIGGSVKTEMIEPTAWLKRTMADIEKCRSIAANASCHEAMLAAIDAMPWIPVGTYRDVNGSMRNWLPVTWRDAFKKAGAYYTLKSLIVGGHVMFHSDDIDCTSIVASLEELSKLADPSVPAFVVYAILKKSIADSKFNMAKFLGKIR